LINAACELPAAVSGNSASRGEHPATGGERSLPMKAKLHQPAREVIMRARFRDRIEAGRLLAEKLRAYEDRPDVLVLGLPRGGVPVAEQVADKLGAPLDVFVVRKLGLPWHPELAMGAIAAGGVRVLNEEVVGALRLPREVIDSVAAREQLELERRERAYRGGRPAPEVKDRVVILVDDGVATGSTMSAAIQALRGLGAARIVAAAPTIASSTAERMRSEADELVAVIEPEEFYGVGQWYEDFSQTSDDEVREILARARHVSRP
jgi:predicted phosphoribosyltransferase